MFNTCIVKNIDSQNHIILGVEVEPNGTYAIPDSKRLMATSNDNLLEGINNNIYQIGNGSNYFSTIGEQLNYLFSGISNVTITNTEIDEEGRQVNRYAAAKKGWTYLAHFFEFETSKSLSLICNDWQGNPDSSLTIKFYDSSNNEIIDQGAYLSLQEHLDNECVRTEVLFKPSFDYELISGTLRMETKSIEDCRLWVIGGVIELGAAGIKEFARNMNLHYLGADEIIETDGRASKYMAKDITGIPYQGNQLKFIVKHSAGYKFKIMPTLEYFRG